MDGTVPLVHDAAAAVVTGSENAISSQFDLRTYIPVFSFLGAACGSIFAVFAQTWIAKFNADRSDISRQAARKEEIVSEGTLELIRLDPYKNRDGEANQSALRSANSVKLFLDKDSPNDQRLEEAIENLVHLYSCVIDPSLDEELVDRLMILKDPDSDASSVSMERLEDLLERLDVARSEVLAAARLLIADDRARLQRKSTLQKSS